MGKPNDGGSAFPLVGSDERVGIWMAHDGMTLRDYFAAAALPAVIALDVEGRSISQDAEVAYSYADAMLKAREAKS